MRRLLRLVAVCLSVLLLSAPVVWACGEAGAGMAHCPMMGEMAGSMEPSMCTERGGQMSMDCCDVRPAPEPMTATAYEGSVTPAGSVLAQLGAAPPLVVETPPAKPPPLDSARLHDLGRYTLFESFLL